MHSAFNSLAVVVALALTACAPPGSGHLSPINRALDARAAGFTLEVPPRDESKSIAALIAGGVTIDEAQRLALMANRKLRAQLEQVSATSAEMFAQAAPHNPELEAQVKIDGDGEPAVELAAMFDLLGIARLPGKRRAARNLREAARLEVAAFAVALTAKTRSAYVRAVAAREQATLYRDSLANTRAALALANQLREAGNISQLELLRHKDAFYSASLAYRDADARRIIEREKLTMTIGVFGRGASFALPSTLPAIPATEVDISKLETTAVDRSLLLAARRHTTRGRSAMERDARVGRYLPALGVGVAAERDHGGGWAIGPAVSLSIPIFGGQRAKARAALAQVRRSTALYFAEAVDVRGIARSAAATLDAARKRAVEYRDLIVPLKQALLDEELKNYNAMNASPFDVLRAKREFTRARAAELDAIADYWDARNGVDVLLAGGVPDRPSVRSPSMDSSESNTSAGGH